MHPNLPSPVSKYPLQYNGRASYQTPKILNPIPGGPSQPGLATNQYLKFSTSPRGRPSQNLVWILPNTMVWPPTKPQEFSTPFQGNLHNTVWALTSTLHFLRRYLHPISTTFPTSNPSHSPNYGSKCIRAFSQQIYH